MPDILERCQNCPFTEKCSDEIKWQSAQSSSYFCHMRRKYMFDKLIEEDSNGRKY